MCSQREDDDLPLTAVDNIQIPGIWNEKGNMTKYIENSWNSKFELL